jgi:hypothetical protein
MNNTPRSPASTLPRYEQDLQMVETSSIIRSCPCASVENSNGMEHNTEDDTEMIDDSGIDDDTQVPEFPENSRTNRCQHDGKFACLGTHVDRLVRVLDMQESRMNQNISNNTERRMALTVRFGQREGILALNLTFGQRELPNLFIRLIIPILFYKLLFA